MIAMRYRNLSALLSTAAFAAAASAQGAVLYYKFDATDATQIVNYATGSSAAPRFGTSLWPAEYIYTSGRTGAALEHSYFGGLSGSFVYTGFTGPLTGSMTIAFALQNGIANSIAEYSPIAGQPSWSIATGGSAGPGLQLRGSGVGDLSVDFGTALCSMPGWNHFAVVVDAAAGTAAWYRNRAGAAARAITAQGQIPAQQELRFGTDYSTYCGGLYNLDEFRLLNRAATPTEVATWATATSAVAVPFGATTNVSLQAVGVPTLGNNAFAVRAVTTGSLVAFAQGFGYTEFGGQPLPRDLGQLLGAPGQSLLIAPASIDLAVTSGGEALLSIAVPANPQVLGFTLALQAAALSAEGTLQVSNGLLISAGQGQ